MISKFDILEEHEIDIFAKGTRIVKPFTLRNVTMNWLLLTSLIYTLVSSKDV